MVAAVSKIKLIDVAEEAGVSKSTVSQFLNGRYQYMSEATRERVKQAVEKFNYVPNNIARSLKTNKTRTVGVIVRDVAGFYTSHAIRGMDDYCKQHGYDMIIYNTDFDPATEARAVRSLGQLRVDGLIIASSGLNTDLLSDSAKNGAPVVQFQLEHDESDKSIVVSDYKQAAFDATEYLIQLGHERICFVTQKFKSVKSRLERFQGYADALRKYAIPLDDQLIQYWQRDAGFQNTPEDVLAADSPPTAFFTQHLALTIDLLKAFDKAGINIPDDVSVIGFDEVPMAEFFKVPLTVVKQEPYLIGVEAAKLLLRSIEGNGMANARVVIPCALIERSSCRKMSL